MLLKLVSSKNDSRENIIGKVTIRNNPHAAAGLNWGYSNAMPGLSDAYIPVLKRDIESNDYTISAKEEPNRGFNAIWDDGTSMDILFEGNNKIGNVIYPKQISSYGDKSIMGRYLRKRIGSVIGINLEFSDYAVNKISNLKEKKQNGMIDDIYKEIIKDNTLFRELEKKFITQEMLNQYGRDYIDITIDEYGVYRLRFWDLNWKIKSIIFYCLNRILFS